MKILPLSVFLLLVRVCAMQTVAPYFKDFLTRLQAGISDVLDDQSHEAQAKLIKMKKTQPVVPEGVPFPCDLTEARSPSPPVNVNEIRPGDIDVVVAVGDGLMMATGAAATNVFQASKPYRGISWAIGGEGSWRKFLTLPNILRVFNPKLVGFSESWDDEQLNFAGPGMSVKNIPFLFKSVVKRLGQDPRVNLTYDWKLVTVMIARHDFCNDFCHYGADFGTSEEICREFISRGLDYLAENLPRTIVNLVPPPAMDEFHLPVEGGFCRTLKSVECPCVFGAMRDNTREENSAMQRQWQEVQQEVAADPKYRLHDFLVVAQPFAMNLSLSTENADHEQVLDKSLLSEDCFHFSQRAHAQAANALWNNMLEPVGQKTEGWSAPFSRFLCPTKKHPYIFSYDNSPGEPVDVPSFPLRTT